MVEKRLKISHQFHEQCIIQNLKSNYTKTIMGPIQCLENEEENVQQSISKKKQSNEKAVASNLK